MQIRCYHCNRPFGLSKETIHAALDQLTAQDQAHYNAPCPHCRKVNRVSRQELLHAAPEWVKPVEEKTENG